MFLGPLFHPLQPEPALPARGGRPTKQNALPPGAAQVEAPAVPAIDELGARNEAALPVEYGILDVDVPRVDADDDDVMAVFPIVLPAIVRFAAMRLNERDDRSPCPKFAFQDGERESLARLGGETMAPGDIGEVFYFGTDGRVGLGLADDLRLVNEDAEIGEDGDQGGRAARIVGFLNHVGHAVEQTRRRERRYGGGERRHAGKSRQEEEIEACAHHGCTSVNGGDMPLFL